MIKSIENIQVNERVHIALYGASGSGKTYAIQTLPGKTLTFDSDKGLLTLKGCKDIDYLNIKSYKDLTIAMKIVQGASEKDVGFGESTDPIIDKYDNIVIDSMSFLGDLLVEHAKIEKITGFDLWNMYEDRLKKVITTLKNSNKVNSVHMFEMVEREDESGILRKRVGLKGSLAARVPYFYDFFFACRCQAGKDKNVYKIQTRTKDGFECKSRLEGLETFIEPDLGKLIEKLRS